MVSAVSKAARARKAHSILMALLKTPKSRPGLVAAVRADGISANYVFGFLSEGRRTGELITYRSGQFIMFQLSSAVVDEKPTASEYPAWLDPRALPTSTGRSVVVDGEIVKIN